MTEPEEPHKIAVRISDSAAPALVVDQQTFTILYANDAFCSLFGYMRGSLIARHVNILVPGKTRPKHSDMMREWFKDPRARLMGSPSSQVYLVDGDGEEKPVTIGLSLCTNEDCVVATIVPMVPPRFSMTKHFVNAFWLILGLTITSIGKIWPNLDLAEFAIAGPALVGLVVANVSRELAATAQGDKQSTR